MPRPKSEDPKVVVTLRLRASDFEAFKASHPDWRGALEAYVRGAAITPPPRAPLPRPARDEDPAPVTGMLSSVPLKRKVEFRPNPKSGRR
jgi:hypothetical protein